MLSKSLISILALTSAVSASPALRRQAQSSDKCQDAYKACKAAGTPEVACGCTLTACVGEDNARNRDYCSSATASLAQASKTTAAPSVCPTALFDGCNPAHTACPNGPGTFTTVSPSTYPTSYVVNGQTVSLTAAPTSCLPTGSSSASASATAPAASGCVAKYNTCRTTRTNGVAANMAQCAADNAACQGACYAAYNTCRGTRGPNGSSANMAQCAAEYAGCLGENPIASTGGLISTFLPYSATASTMATSTAPAASPSAAAPKASSTAAAAAGAPGSNPKKVDGVSWTLNNVIRYCGDNSNTCDYNFDIVANGKTEHCTIVNASKQSFSNQKCANGDYTISWGYVANPAPAFAVITVVDAKNELAWFGASNVDSQRTWGNLGPEQVYTYN